MNETNNTIPTPPERNFTQVLERTGAALRPIGAVGTVNSEPPDASGDVGITYPTLADIINAAAITPIADGTVSSPASITSASGIITAIGV